MRSGYSGLVVREGAHRATLPSSFHGINNLIFLKEALLWTMIAWVLGSFVVSWVQ